MVKIDTNHNEVYSGRQGRFYDNNRWKVVIDGKTFTDEKAVDRYLNCVSECKE